jgi:hypothetical protein
VCNTIAHAGVLPDTTILKRCLKLWLISFVSLFVLASSFMNYQCGTILAACFAVRSFDCQVFSMSYVFVKASPLLQSFDGRRLVFCCVVAFVFCIEKVYTLLGKISQHDVRTISRTLCTTTVRNDNQGVGPGPTSP